jgi:dephospho-CoA kinase
MKRSTLSGTGTGPVRLIGIAGYMGAGKTSAARLLSSAAGPGGGLARVIDADGEAKRLMTAEPRIREQLVKEFGGSIIGKNSISFTALGRIAFTSSAALLRLNAIVHPLLVKRLRVLMEQRTADRIILDAAVLPLWKLESRLDVCLWVHAPFAVRLERLKHTHRDLDERVLCRRMRVQEECLPAPRCPPWRLIRNDGHPGQLAGTLAALFCIL